MAEVVSKEALVKRLKRIEGQIRGLQKMIDEERTCDDVMMQLSAVVSALSRVSELVAKNYAHRCLFEVNETGNMEAIDNLIESIIKFKGV